jgi:hypothetical protein
MITAQSLAAFALTFALTSLPAAAQTSVDSSKLDATAAERAAGSAPLAEGEASDQAQIAAATTATEHWLSAIDAGNLADSWKAAAEVFKLGISEADWVADLETVRNTLGKTTMREFKTARFSTKVRGAPLTGEYVTISYLTKFTNVPIAAETLIVSKEADGEWRIAGYNIGKAPDQ